MLNDWIQLLNGAISEGRDWNRQGKVFQAGWVGGTGTGWTGHRSVPSPGQVGHARGISEEGRNQTPCKNLLPSLSNLPCHHHICLFYFLLTSYFSLFSDPQPSSLPHKMTTNMVFSCVYNGADIYCGTRGRLVVVDRWMYACLMRLFVAHARACRYRCCTTRTTTHLTAYLPILTCFSPATPLRCPSPTPYYSLLPHLPTYHTCRFLHAFLLVGGRPPVMVGILCGVAAFLLLPRCQYYVVADDARATYL